MNIKTHLSIEQKFCGTPLLVESGLAKVELITRPDMAVDKLGLVHGGYVFSLADYAAMLAVNEPNVVLGSAEVRLLKPVRTGSLLTATARQQEVKGKKIMVNVEVCNADQVVMTALCTCFVPQNHVLAALPVADEGMRTAAQEGTKPDISRPDLQQSSDAQSDRNVLPLWDLSPLYVSGAEDPRLKADMQEAERLGQLFAETWRGRIAQGQVSPQELLQSLREYEQLSLVRMKPESFAFLEFSCDSISPEKGALKQKIDQADSRLAALLVFYELELGKMPEELWQEAQKIPAMDEYKHFVEQLRVTAKHMLSAAEEAILEETSYCRYQAYQRLFTEITSRLKYPFTYPGKNSEELTQSELLSLMSDPNREVRCSAASVLSQVLTDNVHPLQFCFNALMQEKVTMDRLRGFTRPEQERNTANELADEVVDTMIDTVVANYQISIDYYRLKRQLLNLDKLYHYDRYAPLNEEVKEVDFSQAKTIVLEAFANFSPHFAELAQQFFDNKWIDARPRSGKRGGAFCAGLPAPLIPYVLVNFTGRRQDVLTLAHELGHGVHNLLAKQQNIFNFSPAMPLCETASTFAELLVFEKLFESLTDPTEQIALLAEEIEGIFACVFRQAAMYRFEQRLYKNFQEHGELNLQQFNDLWQQSIGEMFGNSLTLGEDHAITWSYVPHFINYPFYVYAYTFGELLVLALYARFCKEGEAFKQLYFNLLAAGGSQSPAALLRELGIDISKREFWQSGCDFIKERIAKLEKLIAQVKHPYQDGETHDWNQDAGWGSGDCDGWDGQDEDEIPEKNWDEEV